MEKKWQVMLHEAADASFQKEIEVLAVMDSAAYSYVDLPQTALCTLSEKILLLPHQVIVLLFSRYCFYLSPEDTEKFFQIKNAKGSFRFYRNFLSSSIGLSAEQLISDESLNQACIIAMKEYLRAELRKDPDVHRSDQQGTLIFRRIRKAVAVAAITLVILFSTVMVANAQFREKVIAWVIERFEKYSSFELQSDGENMSPCLQTYHPTYLPTGAKLQNTIELPEFISYKYEVGSSDYFTVLLSQSDIRIYVDVEDADIESLDKNGITGYFFEKDNLKYVCFDCDGCSFAVYGSLEEDELIKIAAGIAKE